MHHLVAEEAGNPRRESEAAGWLPTEARRVPGESWVCRGPPCPILRVRLPVARLVLSSPQRLCWLDFH